MKTQKCCAHCPGKLVNSARANGFHECCQPKYVTGNLKIPSLSDHACDCPKKRKTEEDVAETPKNTNTDARPSCYEHFALAKKLHAENLDHQPLPDKVDDIVFKNTGPERS
nr:uncharacterized protein LOC117223352 [Megalopta genalis]